jgi:uncharacterized protein YdgA (DUF945 family)
MKKGTVTTLAIVILLLLAGLGFGLPYYTGIQTEKHFRQTIEEVIQDSPVSVKEFQYNRGLFSARASSHLEMKVGKDAVVIPVEHEVLHGICPMNLNLVKVVSTIRLPADTPAGVKEFFKDQSPLKITTVVGIDRGMRCEIASPSFDGRLSNDDPYEIHWKGISGTVTLSPDWNRGSMAFLAPSLSVQDQKGTHLNFDTCEMKADLHRGSTERIWLGLSQAGLKKFSLTEKNEQGTDNETARADNFLLSAEVSEKDGALAATYMFGVDKLKATGRDFDKAALEIKLMNLDNQALISLRDKLRDLNKQQADENTRNQETLKTALELLPKFLARSPELAISRLAVGTTDGQVQGDGRLKYIGGQNIQSFQVLKDLEGEAKLTAPKPLVESIALTVAGIGGKDLDEALGDKADALKRQLVQEQIDGLIQDGVIQDQGNAYSSHVVLKGGVLTLNGKPLELPPGS